MHFCMLTCQALHYLYKTIAGFMRFNNFINRMNRFADILRLVFISLIDISAYTPQAEAA